MQDCTLGDARLLCGDALAVLPTLASASVHLILVDPPYYRMKTFYEGKPVAWDRQWPTRKAYLGWLAQLAKEWQRVLTPNGSLYCFASPQMAAWVEVTLSETFHVLNHLVWRKHDGSGAGTGGHSKACKEDLMSFFPQSERIIFAEQYGSDASYQNALVTENSSYWSACEQLKGRIFGAYLKEEFARAGVSQREIAMLFPSASGGLTGCVSNWLLGYNCPTRDQYHAIGTYLNSRNCQHAYLRREYEDLRRPFTVSAKVPYVDVWDFATVPAAPGKHPAEKPLALMRHIITVSSRPGDLVLDPCMGRGSTLEAALQCGRQAIGIEQDPQWWRASCSRLSQLTLF